jgi:hypothetical protein
MRKPDPKLVTPEEAMVAVEIETQGLNPPGPYLLRMTARYLLKNRDKLHDAAMASHLLKIIAHVANAPLPPSSPKAIARMVDWWAADLELTEARRFVAEATGKRLDAVKKAHVRYGDKTLRKAL